MSAIDAVKPGWRLRAIRRRMSFKSFERTIPVRPGWKREYYGGMAHVRPSWTTVTYELDISTRPMSRVRGLRTVTPDDSTELLAAFLDSFRFAPEYAAYPMKGFRAKAAEFVKGFFGEVRGAWSRASTVVIRDRKIVAAALIKDRSPKSPLLDCLLVWPAFFRHGLATAVVTNAVNELAAAGFTTLRSSAMLANEPSLAWHASFGFRELPDMFVAQARYYSASHELHRLEESGQLTSVEREHLTQLIERWGPAAKRLQNELFEKRFAGQDE